jgi:hypothetical protein
MTTHLVTFADESMRHSRNVCAESAKRNGVDHVIHLDFQNHLKRTWTYGQHQALFDQERGLGFWAWKPWAIREASHGCQPGSILIYSDAGVEFINSVSHIIERMDQDIFLFGNQWEHAHWCKRDIVDEIWPIKFDNPIYGPHEVWKSFGKQCQASVIFFRVSDYSKAFVKEWLDWCLFEGGRLIDDSPSRAPNHPEFRENRHDQAILTTMAYREGIKLHWWPASYNDGAFVHEKGDYTDDYPVMFNHHRKRDHEWEQVA